MFKPSGVKLHLLGIGLSFCWSSVNYYDIWNLWQLDIYRIAFLLDVVEVSMPQQVPIPLILFLVEQFPDQILVRD
jgi:hypothetical protein